ncbi:hypothetical protein MVES1_000340 [Malassezia vespertilionis]|uniref:Sap190p n=1 Tax=Malassezia vespertilionis TaxID=2020962 RepID=A0A2N1JG54_9BASI|nr:uncharacterized protein MVES1_000340 [Malassezia vespertilionis]PKI85523.1 Sap190p [Malassezia vespertilionis]WFD05015.1 hypothetical protein MVES1_000340 [Malassezia vespertilionis]
MFWRFGVAPVSNLSNLLEKDDVSLEEILDEQDLLQECKSNNNKLIEYLEQPSVLRRLLDYVNGEVELEGVPESGIEEKAGFKYPYMASEVLSSEIPEISTALFLNASTLLLPFWQDFLFRRPAVRDQPIPLHAHPLTSATYHTKEDDLKRDDTLALSSSSAQKYSARTHGPGQSVLAGYWAKVNVIFLEKNPRAMLELIKTVPSAVEGLVAHFDTPSVVDLLFRMIQCEDTVPDAGLIDWLSQNELIPRVVALLSPHVSPDLHKAASEFLKAIFSLSAPSPSSLNHIFTQESYVGPGEMLLGSGGVNNLLVREVASQDIVDKMMYYMTGIQSGAEGASRMFPIGESAVEEEEDDMLEVRMRRTDRKRSSASFQSTRDGMHRDSTATIRPSSVPRGLTRRHNVSQEAIASSFINCAGVFIELIRKNNSDYFEQHLFHTLRNYLLLRQQEISNQRQREGGSDAGNDDADYTEVMEQAMSEVAEKMGIVHLGPLLRALAEKVPEFQEMLKHPVYAVAIPTTVGTIQPLTQTRYCIAELYAEMLHCSNMALLNREDGLGPQYSCTGTLLDGMEGLHTLARVLQGEDTDNLPDLEEINNGVVAMHNSADLFTTQLDDALPINEQNNQVQGKRSPSALSSASSDSDHDAKSIASVLSGLSLEELTSNMGSRPPSIAGDQVDGTAGDYLKKQFLDYDVIPILLELFLDHPWNNFLHNVVYDIVQQLFNGDMSAGINRILTISTFHEARLIDSILEGARGSAASSKGPRRIRMGYMGHLNLIAEEVLKLLERCPMEVSRKVGNAFRQPDWNEFVDNELRVSRTLEATPLAGGRPEDNGNAWSSDADDWYGDTNGSNTFARYLSAQMRNSVAGDDEDDNEMLAQLGDADAIADGQMPDDDGWGPFADSNAGFNMVSAGASNTSANIPTTSQENLTPADWAAEFRREATASIESSAVENDSDSDSTGSSTHRDDKEGASSTDSDENAGDESPFVDLHKPTSLRHYPSARHAGDADDGKNGSEAWPNASAAKHVRTLSTEGQDKAPILAAQQLAHDVEPTEDGLLRRKLADGSIVTVPLDDAELAESEA